ncbi:hypothetical protein QM480_23755 [Flectobacillus sp. DC10W]|jgi:hypothetical protein|uniref:DUF4397 domain-containing protein n=1 Tax=Flectobacillus longus TaxID=2984207 RepID=A0ABT6YUU1_9BACT|nr:hypothetical protein [Flectobacillus longus]MDI9867379.1 hypothetical protein [Flectobacillus longus]
MKKLVQKYFVIAKVLQIILFVTFVNTVVIGQNLGCNFKPGTITLNLTGQSQGSNIVTYIVLVDGGNIIKYKSALNATTIDNVVVGSYKAVAVTWDNTQANAPVLEIGLNLNNVDHCWKSIAVDMSICDCNTTTNSITVPVSTGLNPQYVLTNGRGVIQAIQPSTTFSGLTNDVYNVYVACGIGTAPNLLVGSNIKLVTTSDLCEPIPLPYVVCVAECAPVICLPMTVLKLVK